MTNKIVIAATNKGFILSEDDIALLRTLDDGSLQDYNDINIAYGFIPRHNKTLVYYIDNYYCNNLLTVIDIDSNKYIIETLTGGKEAYTTPESIRWVNIE